MPEWFENFFDGLYAKVLSRQFDEAQTQKQVRVVARLLKLRKNQKVLDIPCGIGRLTIPLAKMGFEMTGVDLAASYIKEAQKLARKENLKIRFMTCDMRDINFDGEFDAAFNWYTSFGYFSDTDNFLFLQRIFKALRPGGKFLIEMINKSCVLSHFPHKSDEVRGGVRIITTHHRYDAKSSRFISRWKLIKGKKTESYIIEHKMFNGMEIRSLLRVAGFRDIRLYGRPPVGRLTRHSRRLIALANKPVK